LEKSYNFLNKNIKYFLYTAILIKTIAIAILLINRETLTTTLAIFLFEILSFTFSYFGGIYVTGIMAWNPAVSRKQLDKATKFAIIFFGFGAIISIINLLTDFSSLATLKATATNPVTVAFGFIYAAQKSRKKHLENKSPYSEKNIVK
jgi:hypothetical protein